MGDGGQLLVDIGLIDHQRLAAAIFRLEAHILQQLFHDGLQAAGADILDLAVHLGRDLRDRADAFGRQVDRYFLGRQQRALLRIKAGLGVGQDRDEILLGQRLQFHADRQAALKFGQQVAGLGDMEGA